MNCPGIRLRPTGLWFLFGPILGCMWLAAVNYSNNLVYAILYLIGSLTFVSLFHTRRNIASLEVGHVRLHPAFAGGNIRLEIHLRNNAARTIDGLSFACLESNSLRETPLPLPAGGVVRIRSQETIRIEISFPAPSRGRYRFSSLIVRSSYPFGLFHAVLSATVAADYFVYPKLQGTAALPERHPGESDESSLKSNGGNDFAGVRPYAPGESWRHVDWKAYARGRPLLVKQFAGESDREFHFDADDLPLMSLEERLSQLALWIVEAEKSDFLYALKSSGVALPMGNGSAHARCALEILSETRDFQRH